MLPCEEKEPVGVIELRILKWGDYSRLWERAVNPFIGVLVRERQRETAHTGEEKAR